MALALHSTSSHHNGIPYTAAERSLARQILTLLFPLAEVLVAKPEAITREVTATYELLEPNISDKSVEKLSRAVFRQVVRDRTEDGKKFNQDYPKLRDPASIQLLFRAACAEIGASCMTDDIFPRPGKKTQET